MAWFVRWAAPLSLTHASPLVLDDLDDLPAPFSPSRSSGAEVTGNDGGYQPSLFAPPLLGESLVGLAEPQDMKW